MLLRRLIGGGGFRAATPENPRFNLNDPEAWDALGAKPTSTGQQVSPESVLTWSAWWRGVSLLAKLVAKCPCHVYETDPDGDYGAAIVATHPAYRLLRWKPNEVMTAFQFKLAMMGHAINRGNGYAYIFRDGPAPRELVILDPDSTFPQMIGGALWYVTKSNGEQRKLPAADVFHLRGFGFDGIQGYPLWQMAKESISLGLSAERFRGSRYKSAARPSVVLETPNKMQDQAITRLRADWERLHSGIDNAHRTAILDNGLKANTLSFSPEQMQEVESAGLLLRDAANFLGVPSSKLGDVAGVKYASKEQDDQSLLDDGLDFWFCAFESEAWDKLLLESEKDAGTRIVSFDRETLIRMDFTTAATYYRTATGGRGWMSPAEVREKMHLEPRDEPDIDTILTPLNMGRGGADNQPTDLAKPAPGAPKDNSNPAASLVACDKGDGLVRMSAVRDAARVVLCDAARRMVRRVALHATRAAKEPGKYLAWVDAVYADHKDVAREAFEPARQMALALGGEAHTVTVAITEVFLSELRAEYSRVADTASAAKLPGAVDALNAAIETRLPRRLCDLFLGADDGH